MKTLFRAAAELERFLVEQGWRYCFIGGIAFEEQIVSRATRYEFLPGLSLLTCSAEDLVVLKAFADRPRDWADVQTIVARQPTHLDWKYIFRQLEPLCQIRGDSEVLERLRRLHRLAVSQLERKHRQGYERTPPDEGEFDIWENEQVGPDS